VDSERSPFGRSSYDFYVVGGDLVRLPWLTRLLLETGGVLPLILDRALASRDERSPQTVGTAPSVRLGKQPSRPRSQT
jgi:hypothetical protein